MIAPAAQPETLPPQETDPSSIVRLIASYRGARILTTAVSLGVFDAFALGPKSASTIARALKTDHRATAILLNALVSLGFLTKTNETFANAPVSEQFLKRNSPGSLASNMRYQELLAPAWAELPKVIQKGKPTRSLEQFLGGPDFSREYILGMADISKKPARQLADCLDLARARRGLDVGAGPGVFASTLIDKQPLLKMDLLDLPTTLKITADVLKNSPHKNSIDLKPGNYHRAPFGKNTYDLILFSHVTHDEGEKENLSLLRKAFAALKPGGQVVIHDFVLDPDKTHPTFAALFSVHMLVYTRRGQIYTAEEYETWLQDTGFSLAGRFDICPGAGNASKAIVAVKS